MEPIKRKGSISEILSEARASLKNPSRPFTPREKARPLLSEDDCDYPSIDDQTDSKPHIPIRSFSKSSPSYTSRHRSSDKMTCKDEDLNKLTQQPYNSSLDDYNDSSSSEAESKTADKDLDPSPSKHSATSSLFKLTQKLETLDKRLKMCEESSDQIKIVVEILEIFSSPSSDSIIKEQLKNETSTSFITILLFSCECLFHLSTNSINDTLFMSREMIECLLRYISLERRSCGRGFHYPLLSLVYLSGVFKNISIHEEIQDILAAQGAISIFSSALEAEEVVHPQDKKIVSILIQITATLRNLSVDRKHHRQFIASNTILKLCNLLYSFNQHPELLLNILRVLSKLSLHEKGRSALNEKESNLLAIQDLLTQGLWEEKDLIVRVCYTLGNLTTSNDSNRILLSSKALSNLLSLLSFYTQQRLDQDQLNLPMDEVLVKAIRLLANLSINPKVAEYINSCSQIKLLRDLLISCQTFPEEELLLNVVGCITNLSFYFDDRKNHIIMIKMDEEIILFLMDLLLHENEEVVVESLRALGNFSRFNKNRKQISQSKGMEISIALLDHSLREIVYNSCGMLMNVALNELARIEVLDVFPQVVNILIGIFRSAGLRDLDMGIIASKALYNLFLSSEAMHMVKEKSNLLLLLETLEELLQAIRKPDSEEQIEYLKVGTALYERVSGKVYINDTWESLEEESKD